MKSCGLLCALVWLVFAGEGSARPLFAPPDGFWIRPSDHSPVFYGPSRRDAHWTIAQWDTPDDLPPFQGGRRAANADADVELEPDGSYVLHQHAAALPCERAYPSGRRLVDEFDLLASLGGGRQPGTTPARRPDDGPTLARATHVIHEIGVEIMRASAYDTVCPATQTGFLTAIVLTDQAARQAMFYQIRLALLKSSPGGLRSVEAPPNWFAKGVNGQNGRHGQFGAGDPASLFGQGPARAGHAASFRFDLLPRLTELIRQGVSFGMDQDLSHWRVTGTYHGSNVIGHMDSAARWSGFRLEVE